MVYPSRKMCFFFMFSTPPVSKGHSNLGVWLRNVPTPLSATLHDVPEPREVVQSAFARPILAFRRSFGCIPIRNRLHDPQKPNEIHRNPQVLAVPGCWTSSLRHGLQVDLRRDLLLDPRPLRGAFRPPTHGISSCATARRATYEPYPRHS